MEKGKSDIDKRQFSRVEAFIPLSYRLVPEQELAFLKSRILDQTYPKNPKALPETADSALYGSLCILNAKLDQILHLLTLRNEGFNALSSRLVNISGAGLCFTTPEKFAEGDIIEIKTVLSPHKNRALSLYGMIIASEEKAEGYRLSLSFVQMDDSVREEIVKFVFERERELLREKRGS